MGSQKDVEDYTTKKGLKGHALHGCGNLSSDVSSAYGIMYIPHKVLVDKNGIVVKNFTMGALPNELDALLASGAEYVAPEEPADAQTESKAESKKAQ